MSTYEMMKALVEHRRAEGVSPEAIRAELGAMGISASDADRLMAAQTQKGPKSRSDLSWWEFFPLIPVWLAPMVLIVLAAILETPQFAVAMLVTGLILQVIARIAMIILAFSENVIIGIFYLICACPLIELMLLFTQFRKVWKVFLCALVGVGLMLGSFAVDGKAVSKFLELEKRARAAQEAAGE